MVVQDPHVDVARAQARVAPQPTGHRAHLRQARQVIPVEAGHLLLRPARALGRSRDHGRGTRQIPGALQGRDDDRLPPVGLLAAVQQPPPVGLLAAAQQPQRLHDPAGRRVFGQGDRTAVEVRRRVRRRVPAVHHGHVPEHLRRQPVRVQIPLGRHRHPGGRGEQPERQHPAERHALRRGLPVLHARAEPAARPLVEGAVADHYLRHARRHRERRLQDRRTGRAAAVVDPREEGQLTHPAGLGHRDLRVGVHRERHHAVHVRRCQPGVVQRGTYGLHGQPQLTAPGVLGELGGPDAGDRGPSGQGVAGAHAHERSSGSGAAATASRVRAGAGEAGSAGTVTVTVPVT